MTGPVNWAGRTFGQLSPEEKRRAAAHAGAQLQAELTAAAPAIGRIMDDVDRGPLDGLTAAWDAEANRTAPTGDRHDFQGARCPHWRCGEANGWQCAECGHYFAREAVRMDPDSEVRCRAGMGHEREGAYR